MAGREPGVREGGFYQRLAVVEGAVDGEGGDILAQGRELPFLEGGDAAARIEHHGPHPLPLPERLGDRRAGVAAGGGEDGDRMAGIAHQVEHGGEEAGAEVLEGQGRPMEQLEGEDAGADFHQRHREVESVAHGAGDRLAAELAGQQAVHHDLATLAPVQIQQLRPVVEAGEGSGEPEAAARGDPAPGPPRGRWRWCRRRGC